MDLALGLILILSLLFHISTTVITCTFVATEKILNKHIFLNVLQVHLDIFWVYWKFINAIGRNMKGADLHRI